MAYITRADADLILTSAAWVAASDSDKDYALLLGAAWIDDSYSCPIASPAETNLQRANALLADISIAGDLFTPKPGDVSSVSIKAGPVSIDETYIDSDETEDPFAEIKLLLTATTCSKNAVMSIVRA